MKLNFGNVTMAITRKKRFKGFLPSLLGPIGALVLAFLAAAIVIILSGANPLVAYKSMLSGAFGSTQCIAETLVKTTPLLLCGLGLTIAYRAGLVSIGSEGQMIMGGLFATLAGIYLKGLPSIVLIPIVMLAGILGGAIWAGIPGYLKAKLGVSEVINTIMLNYIAIYLISYLLDGPIKEPGGYFPQSAQIIKGAWLPYVIQGTRLHIGIIFAIVSILIVYFILWRSPLGFQMRAVGYNQTAAKNNGIKIGINLVLALGLSGAFAGLAGAVEISGLHHRLMNGFSSNYGFDAMAIALLGKLNPIGVAIASVLFGALRVGANMMQRTVQVPASLVYVIQGMIIIFSLMDEMIRNFTVQIFIKKAGKEK